MYEIIFSGLFFLSPFVLLVNWNIKKADNFEGAPQIYQNYLPYFSNFFTIGNKEVIIPKISDDDYLYIYDILAGLSNTSIAKKIGVNESTVIRRLSKTCEKLGVNSKKEMIEYLHTYM